MGVHAHAGASAVLRWSVLGVFCLTTFSASLSGLAFAPIAKRAAEFFGVSFNAINQISIASSVFPVLGMPPAMWLADTSRFEVPFFLGLLCTMAVAWARFLLAVPGVRGYWAVLGTQTAMSLISPCLTCLAPSLSRSYFPVHQRTLATSLGTIAQLLGIGAGLVLSPVFEDDIPGLLYVHAVAISVPFLLGLFSLDMCACCRPCQQTQHQEQPGQARGVGGGRTRLAPGGQTTSFHRLLRSASMASSASALSRFSPRPEEHMLVVTREDEAEARLEDRERERGRVADREAQRQTQTQAQRGPRSKSRKGRRPHKAGDIALPFVFHNYGNSSIDDDEAGALERSDAYVPLLQDQQLLQEEERTAAADVDPDSALDLNLDLCLEGFEPSATAAAAAAAASTATTVATTATARTTETVERAEAAETTAEVGYAAALGAVLCDGAFMRLLGSISLLSSVISAWMSLVNEAAPPSLDSPLGAQLVAGLFFGCGTLGAVAMSLAADRTRAYARIGRVSLLCNMLPASATMLAWHADCAVVVYCGAALMGLLGFGMMPLCIEFGIELTYVRHGPRLGATIAGVMLTATNVAGVGVLFLTTPGNVPGLAVSNIPLVWLLLFSMGSLLFLTVPARYKRLECELEDARMSPLG